jgi:hypothetical protein
MDPDRRRHGSRPAAMDPRTQKKSKTQNPISGERKGEIPAAMDRSRADLKISSVTAVVSG